MGYSLYCFHNNKNVIIEKSDLNIQKAENFSESNNKEFRNYIYSSNNKSTITSQKSGLNNTIINPLPDIVIIKPKKIK